MTIGRWTLASRSCVGCVHKLLQYLFSLISILYFFSQISHPKITRTPKEYPKDRKYDVWLRGLEFCLPMADELKNINLGELRDCFDFGCWVKNHKNW